MQGVAVDRPLTRFVGLRVTGPPDDLSEQVADARKALLRRQYEISRVNNPYQQLGVTLPGDHEDSEDTITTYIGFEVEQYGDVPAGLVTIDLQPGRYAQFTWKGSVDSEEFERFYPGIFSWFRDQKLVPSTETGWIEVYDEDYDWEDRDNANNRLEALIPIAGGSR
jgi:predicted transcriptional regulator YdeE